LQTDDIHLPQDRPLPNDQNGQALPYVLVGDAAFPLQRHLLRPYPGRGLDVNKRIFNYRLSRARRVVESAFGILAQRWRIFHRKINLLPENVVRVVKATVILHNLLQKNCSMTSDSEDFWNPNDLVSLRSSRHHGSLQSRRNGAKVRDAFKDYFHSAAGAVHWQNRSVYNVGQPVQTVQYNYRLRNQVLLVLMTRSTGGSNG